MKKHKYISNWYYEKYNERKTRSQEKINPFLHKYII